MSQVEPVENIALIYDASITHQSALVIEIVKEILPATANLVVCHVNRIGDHSDKLDSSTNISYSSFGRNVPECVHGWLEGSTLIFVGSKGSPLLPLWLMTFVQFTNVLHYSPLEKECKLFKSSASRQLKKRLFLIEKLRDANTVGLVIGTLAVQGFREAITRVRELCKAAHKKLYVFSIGKLNEAKLSNFAGDIDVFILLSCPFGIVLNNEYYKPIVSLFEAEIALNPDRQWYSGSGWTAEFNEITLKDTIGSLKKDEADVSLITGKMRFTQVEDVCNSTSDDNKKQLVNYSAGDYFANRTWKGLDDEVCEENETSLKTGLSGVAASYASEKES